LPPDLATNVLYYGENMVYLDPPFNSNRAYNLIFRDESGQRHRCQLLAPEDTWHS